MLKHEESEVYDNNPAIILTTNICATELTQSSQDLSSNNQMLQS